MYEYQTVLRERAAREALKEILRDPPAGTFEYGGYHFIPYRAFYKGDTDQRLATDSRPWKMDANYEMRNIAALKEKNPLPDKATDPMGWAAAMDNFRSRAEEVVLHELIHTL
jgi:hypothetical protein